MATYILNAPSRFMNPGVSYSSWMVLSVVETGVGAGALTLSRLAFSGDSSGLTDVIWNLVRGPYPTFQALYQSLTPVGLDTDTALTGTFRQGGCSTITPRTVYTSVRGGGALGGSALGWGEMQSLVPLSWVWDSGAHNTQVQPLVSTQNLNGQLWFVGEGVTSSSRNLPQCWAEIVK